MHARRLALFLSGSLLAAALAPGCTKTECEEETPLLELEIDLSGVDAGQATRLELESRIATTDGAVTDRRIVSYRYAAIVTGGALRLLVDLEVPGIGPSRVFTLIARVWAGPLLIAEGSFQESLSVPGCFLSRTLAVSASPTCVDKQDGVPCVGTDGAPAVCKCAGGAPCTVPICEASSCGDGYVDRRSGELCDPGQAGSTLTCDANTCLPAPLDIPVSDATPSAAVQGSSAVLSIGRSDAAGLYSLDVTGSATRVPVGTLIARDIDGDGLQELVWGVPEGAFEESLSRREVGIAYVVDAPMIGSHLLGVSDRQLTTITIDDAQSEPYWLGASLAAGDMDNDSTADLAIGAPRRQSGDGAVYLFRGGNTGAISPDADGNVIELDTPGAATRRYETITGSAGELLGYAVAVADFDGDGEADVAMGAPGYDNGSAIDAGRVYITRGAPQPDNVNTITDRAATTLTGSRNGIRFGVSLATGDLDGDGVADLVVGSQASPAPGPNAGFGAVYVLFGGADFPLGDVDAAATVPGALSLRAPDAGSPYFGIGGAVAVGDLDGDGSSELAVSVGRLASSVSPRAVYLIPGSAFAAFRDSGQAVDLDTHAVRLQGTAAERFGAFLRFDDANGDKRQDLLISAPSYSAGGADAGALYVLLGTPRADLWGTPVHDVAASFSGGGTTLAWVRLYGDVPGGALGTSAVASGDLGLVTPSAESPNLWLLQPGVPEAPATPTGKLWSVRLGALLPCGTTTDCLPAAP